MKKKYFKYVVLIVVLFIPFIYSFFYLKAYWNPYGKGNIDNIPVAIINADKGKMGNKLIKSIKEKKKLKLSIVSGTKATKGLYDGDYYAVITIPEDFSSNIESAATTNKHHAMITYSPNQKSNYLASQIINNVVLTVEKNLDNQVNTAIVSNLSNNVKTVPEKLTTISDGFVQLKQGTSKISDGSRELNQGTNSLKSNYSKFNSGIKTIKEGTNKLNSSSVQLSDLKANLNELGTGVKGLKTGTDSFTLNFNNYVDNMTNTLSFTETSAQYIQTMYEADSVTHNGVPVNLYMASKQLTTNSLQLGNTNKITYLKKAGTSLKTGNSEINSGITTLNNKVSNLSTVNQKITQLQEGIMTLNGGVNKLYDSSLQISSGIDKLNNGATTLNNGIMTLDNSVKTAKDELNYNLDKTNKDMKKIDGLSRYSEEPITINTETVNKVSSYGTAFSPFFISIALWVGSLMMFIVLYYDKEERFGVLCINSDKRVKRTLCYHALATVAAVVLGITLNLLLDFEISNILLYYVSIILISNAFMAIIEFLIENFSDIGKFIALIILVLQLAASGGTFPIETVTKGFRWMNSILPMTYTVKLLRESLVCIENKLLTKNVIIVVIIFVVFFVINIVINTIKQNKQKNR